MSVSKLFSNYSVKLHADAEQEAAAVYVNAIREVGFSLGLRTVVEAGDGNLFASFGSLVAGAPTARFTTLDLKTVLDEIPLMAGMPILSDGTHPGVELYSRKRAQGGGNSTSSDAHKVTIANGLAVVRSIRASHQGQAEIAVEVIARKESSTAPVVFDEASALPASSPGASVVWTLGPVDLDGTTIDGLESVEIDTGLQILSEAKDSDVYPTFVSIVEQRPTVRLRGCHIDVTTTLTEDGLYKAASTVEIFFRKRAEGGTFVADATAEHIQLVLGKCRVEVVSVEGDPKMVDIVLTPWATIGSVDPITVDTTAALP